MASMSLPPTPPAPQGVRQGRLAPAAAHLDGAFPAPATLSVCVGLLFTPIGHCWVLLSIPKALLVVKLLQSAVKSVLSPCIS